MIVSEANVKQAVELLKVLISSPSISREEGDATDKLQLFIERGAPVRCDVRRHLNNLWCIAPGFDASRPTLLLDAHIDTVNPVAGWSKHPFTPIVEGDVIYGLGSNDDGASLVTMLQVFYNICQKPQQYNTIFLASAEEEVSGTNGIEAVLPHLPAISCAIVGEPTSMQPAIAEKGLMVLDCVAEGVSGHAARNEGVNALYKAIADIEWFRGYNCTRTSELLGDVKMTVTQINAGTQHNVIPDECRFVIDIRTTDAYSNEDTVAIVQQLLESDAKERSTRVHASAIYAEHPLVKAATAIGRETFVSPTTSDMALMHGIPSLKMGVGQSARSHGADEYVMESEIEEGIAIYQQLLDELKQTI